MFHVEQKELMTMILDQERHPAKIFFGIIAALVPYSVVFMSQFYWVLPIKVLVILYCFGFVKAYKFDSYNNNKIIYRFLYITIYQKPLRFSGFEYVSVFTNSYGFGYCLNIFKGMRHLKVYASNFYDVAKSKGKTLSEILDIKLYTPLE